MNKNFIVKRCASCGAIIKLLSDCDNSSIKCCDKEMETLVPNSTSAVVEKHVPNYEVDGNFISANVAHVMEDDHFIEWICLVSEDKEYFAYFVPGSDAVAKFPYVPGSTLYSYCNKHGLWKTDVV